MASRFYQHLRWDRMPPVALSRLFVLIFGNYLLSSHLWRSLPLYIQAASFCHVAANSKFLLCKLNWLCCEGGIRVRRSEPTVLDHQMSILSVSVIRSRTVPGLSHKIDWHRSGQCGLSALNTKRQNNKPKTKRLAIQRELITCYRYSCFFEDVHLIFCNKSN